jgi:hypothetical protein
MNTFARALKKLRHAALNLKGDQGRIARRNARRKVLGALRSLRNALDAEFPQFQKAKVPPPPAEPRPREAKPKRLGERLVLPFQRGWIWKEVKLFVRMFDAHFGIQLGDPFQFEPNENAGDLMKLRNCSAGLCGPRLMYFGPDWSPGLCWKHLLHGLAHRLADCSPEFSHLSIVSAELFEREVIEFWARFWTGPVPVSDLELAAKHHAFLEERGKKQ